MVTKSRTKVVNIPEDVELYEFLFTDGEIDRVELGIKVREIFDELAKTASSIRFTNKRYNAENSEQYLTQDEARMLTPDLMWLLGSWTLSDRHELESPKSVRWINPHYLHLPTKTDCIVECECGGVTAMDDKANLDDNPLVGKVGHNQEKCRMQWRYRARAELADKRYEKIKKGYWLGKKSHQIAPRLGMVTESVSHLSQSVGLDPVESHQYGRKCWAYTIHVLLEDGYSKTQLCKLFDVSYHKLRILLREQDIYEGYHDK